MKIINFIFNHKDSKFHSWFLYLEVFNVKFCPLSDIVLAFVRWIILAGKFIRWCPFFYTPRKTSRRKFHHVEAYKMSKIDLLKVTGEWNKNFMTWRQMIFFIRVCFRHYLILFINCILYSTLHIIFNILT